MQAQVRPLRDFSYEQGGEPKLTQLPSGRIIEKQESVKFEELIAFLIGKREIFLSA